MRCLCADSRRCELLAREGLSPSFSAPPHYLIDKGIDCFPVNTLPHDIEAKKRLMLTFKNAQRQSQLKRYTCFALAYHSNVRFKNRENPLTVLNRLTQKETAQYLVVQRQRKTVKPINDLR